jgi:hypothetical protein
VVIALLKAPTIIGMTNYMNSERKYSHKVVCKSSQGTVYCIRAKELVHHISRVHRHRLQRAAEAEQFFYDSRELVLRKVASPMDHLQGSSHGKRRVVEEETILKKLQKLNGEGFEHMSVYSHQGRLRALATVFQERDKKALHDDGVRTPADGDVNVNEKAQRPAQNKERKLPKIWWMEQVISDNPDAVGPRLGQLLRKLDVDLAREEAKEFSKSALSVTNASHEDARFACASHEDAKLELAWDMEVFHAVQPDRQPLGRADGATPVIKPVHANLLDTSVRAATAMSARSISPSSRSFAPSRCSPRLNTCSTIPDCDMLESRALFNGSKLHPTSKLKSRRTQADDGIPTEVLELVGLTGQLVRRCHTAPAHTACESVLSHLSIEEMFEKSSPPPQVTHVEQTDEAASPVLISELQMPSGFQQAANPVQITAVQMPAGFTIQCAESMYSLNPKSRPTSNDSMCSKLPELIVPTLTDSLSDSLIDANGTSIPAGLFSDDILESAKLAQVDCPGKTSMKAPIPCGKNSMNIRQEKLPGLVMDISDVYIQRVMDIAKPPSSCFMHPSKTGRSVSRGAKRNGTVGVWPVF